jgi:hypothetical protein
VREGGILLSVPTLGMLDVEVASHLFGLARPLNTALMHCWPVGYSVDDARNFSAEAAIREKCEYLFFVDYDVVLPGDALTRLVSRKADVIGGLYFSKSKPPFPLVLSGGHPTMDWAPGDVVKVDAMGMGCTLIRVDILTQLGPPWFKTGEDATECDGVAERRFYTEDTYFFRRVKDELGIAPYVDTGVSCIHKDLATGERFFLEDGLPTWADADGTKHVVATVAQTKVVDLTKESETE